MNAPAPPQARLEFVDLVRGAFILLMIEGHTLRALLDPAIQQTPLFRAHELPHNLTGPAFLFASGAAFVYSTRNRWEEFRRWSAPLRRRLLRWLTALVVGYSLQLTYGTLGRSLAETTPEQLAFLLSTNILQCIAYSLMLLQLLVLVFPSQRRFVGAALLAAVVMALGTPFAWDAGLRAPLWLASLLSGRTRSVFPLFPYTSFAMAGAVFGYLHAQAREKGREAVFLRSTVRVCVWLCLGSALVALLPLPQIYSDFWYTSPLFVSLRVGLLALLMIGARRMEPYLNPLWCGLVIVGRESFLVYVAHLAVLYGSAFNPDTSIVKWVGKNQPLGDALAATLIFTAAMVVLALCWGWWKRGRDWQVAAAQWIVGGYFLYRFLLA